MRLSGVYTSIHIFIFLALLNSTSPPAVTALDAVSLLRKMEEAYAGVRDYQLNVEVRRPSADGSFKTKKFLYTFKKPNRIRLDYESPYKGTILVYPHKGGQVLVRPWGWTGLFEFHLEPDGFLLRDSSGQRIDQTDIGLLIRNIAKSLTEGRHGNLLIGEKDGHTQVQVLAESHFQEGVVTQYKFLIDKKTWLPAGVEESTSEGALERKITFRNLRVNIGVPDSAFELERE